MQKPGGPAGMGGMKPPGGGEVPEEFSQMMGGANTQGSQSPAAAQKKMLQQAQQQQAKPQRSVGSVVEEAKRAASDIVSGLKDFFSVNSWLGIDANNLDPEEQMHAKKVHQRYQQLDQEQQMVAKQLFEKRMQEKQMQEEEELRKKQIKEQQKAQSIQMPSGPQKGPVGPGAGKSKKQNAMQQLQQDRTTMGRLQGE